MAEYLIDNPPRVYQFRRPRRGTVTGCIVVHTAESALDGLADGVDASAENVARFIRDRSDYGSYHRLVDSDSIVALVPFDAEAYGDGTGSNLWALHLSFACRTTDWKTMGKARRDATIRNGAKAAAEMARWVERTRKIKVPAKRISKADSDRGLPGFIAHGTRDPGRRSDPGADFPWDDFLAAFVAEMRPPKKTPLLTAFRLAPTVALRVAAARRIVRRGSKVLRADAQAYIDARAEVAAARKRRTTQVKAARKKATTQIQAATKRAKAARRRLLSKEVQ